jgi:hypothetical protein
MAATKTIKGIVRDGKVELSEKLDAADGTEVEINVPIERQNGSRRLTFGMFKGPKQTTEEDFKLAEWHGREKESDAG